MSRAFAVFGLVLGVVTTSTVWHFTNDEVAAQVARPAAKKPAPKTAAKTPAATPAQLQDLEQRAKKTQDEFIRESVELAKDFEQAGLLEEAKKILEVVQKVNNDLPGMKEKLDELQDSILTSNKSTLELDVSKGWVEPVGQVEKGKTFRLEATGTYRFVAQINLGAAGIATDDPLRGMLPDVKFGAVAALIVPLDAKGKPGKPLDPIEIGDGRDITPKESGLLFVNVNLPPGHKSTGKLDLQVSGYLRRLGK